MATRLTYFPFAVTASRLIRAFSEVLPEVDLSTTMSRVRDLILVKPQVLPQIAPFERVAWLLT